MRISNHTFRTKHRCTSMYVIERFQNVEEYKLLHTLRFHSSGTWLRVAGWSFPGVPRKSIGLIWKIQNAILLGHFYLWDEATILPRKVVNRLPSIIASHPRRRETSAIRGGNLNTGLLNCMLVRELVYRATKTAGRGSRSRRPGLLCAQNPGIFTTLGNTIFPFRRTLRSDGWPQCPVCVRVCRARQTLGTHTLKLMSSLSLSLSLSHRSIACVKPDSQNNLIQLLLINSFIALCSKLWWLFSSSAATQTKVVFEFFFTKISPLNFYMLLVLYLHVISFSNCYTKAMPSAGF